MKISYHPSLEENNRCTGFLEPPARNAASQLEARVEKWTSTEGRTEIHYFDRDTDEYLFGYNPLLFPDFPEKFLVR